jgi:hypothetical protein
MLCTQLLNPVTVVRFTSPPGPLSTRGEGEKRGPEVPSPYLERGFRGEVNKGQYPY